MATLVGCSSSGGMSMPFASKGEDRAQLAAYAASTHYPGDVKPSSDARVAALISPKGDSVKIVNFQDQPIREANIWINRTFVHKVPTIPPHGSVDLSSKQFFDASGQEMSKLNTGISEVEMQAGNQLYSLWNARTD
jgi:Tol biopolymer transport system component